MTLYTSPATVKRDTPLGSAVDDNILLPYIRMAQDKEILPYLGSKLDAKLKTDIEGDALSGVYKALVDDYIVHALSQFAFVLVAPVLRIRFSNNSVTVVTSEQGQSASRNDIKAVTDAARQMGEFYRERMVEHITHNISDFPEYQQNTGEDLHPTKNSYFENLNLDRTYRSNSEKAIIQALNIHI